MKFDWDELRRRLDPPDRRRYAFFHPSLVDEPLIFVEVALTSPLPAAIAPLLAAGRAPLAPEAATTRPSIRSPTVDMVWPELVSAISSSSRWSRRSAANCRRSRLSSPCRRSPASAPGSRRPRSGDRAHEARRAATAAEDNRLDSGSGRSCVLLEPLAAYYFLKARRPDGRVLDPVARFHLGNGARLERINWKGDLSPRGSRESLGIMVNYLYDLDEIERNHEAFVNRGQIAASAAVKKLLPTGPSRLRAALPSAPASNP